MLVKVAVSLSACNGFTVTVTVSLSAYDGVTVTVSLSAYDDEKFESISISAVGSNLVSSVRERFP